MPPLTWKIDGNICFVAVLDFSSNERRKGLRQGGRDKDKLNKSCYTTAGRDRNRIQRDDTERNGVDI